MWWGPPAQKLSYQAHISGTRPDGRQGFRPGLRFSPVSVVVAVAVAVADLLLLLSFSLTVLDSRSPLLEPSDDGLKLANDLVAPVAHARWLDGVAMLALLPPLSLLLLRQGAELP